MRSLWDLRTWGLESYAKQKPFPHFRIENCFSQPETCRRFCVPTSQGGQEEEKTAGEGGGDGHCRMGSGRSPSSSFFLSCSASSLATPGLTMQGAPSTCGNV